MKQRGFFIPSPTMILAGALALALLATFIQTLRLDAEQKAFELFQVQTKAVGDAQEAETMRIEAKHIEIVKEKNNENIIAHAKLADTAKRLRDTNSRRGYLPSPSDSAASPTVASFDRAILERAIRDFDGEVSELVIEGDKAIIDLNTGKEWVKALH